MPTGISSRAARDGAAVRALSRTRFARSADIAERCTFSLRELRYQYPYEAVMAGRTPQEALAQLTREALPRRYPARRAGAYAKQLDHELGLIEQLGYAPYFLTVNSIVAYARSQGILCQGRGSAANSVVCFCSASPRSIRSSTSCCSSGSSRRSARSRPTSTSISSMSGARR